MAKISRQSQYLFLGQTTRTGIGNTDAAVQEGLDKPSLVRILTQSPSLSQN